MTDGLFSVSTLWKLLLALFIYKVIQMIAGFYNIDASVYDMYIYFYLFLFLAYLFLPTTIYQF